MACTHTKKPTLLGLTSPPPPTTPSRLSILSISCEAFSVESTALKQVLSTPCICWATGVCLFAHGPQTSASPGHHWLVHSSPCNCLPLPEVGQVHGHFSWQTFTFGKGGWEGEGTAPVQTASGAEINQCNSIGQGVPSNHQLAFTGTYSCPMAHADSL